MAAGQNVFLYVPNIIGYSRLVLLGCSCYYILDSYRLGLLLYIISAGLDAFDGLAARLLNQSSKFGSMLDMITDRISTMCLLMTLARLYGEHFFVLQLLLVIDIVSHWLHFFSATMQGKESHKTSDEQTNTLMRLYYGNRYILTSVCAMEQIFYCLFVIFYFEHESIGDQLLRLILVCFPATVLKNYINILQIRNACSAIARADEQRAHGQ